MKITLNLDGFKGHIKLDGGCYVLVKEYIIQTGQKKGEVAERELGYFSNMQKLIEKVTYLDFESRDGEMTLKEFIDAYSEIRNSIRQMVTV